MKCLRCNWENPADMHFCGMCGFALTSPPGQNLPIFSSVESSSPLVSFVPDGLITRMSRQPDKISGERRQITVMFCDMKGFTPLTHRLGPEETFEMMEKILEMMIQKVHKYNGIVNEVRGDGILAIFGAMDALEDAPQRAILTSIAIHEGMGEISERLQKDLGLSPIFMRIGINSGTVAIGTIRTDLKVQLSLVGDTINMASRMESIAEPGTTYITYGTYRLVKGLFSFQPLGKKFVKGMEDPISVYKVLSAQKNVYRPRLGSERMIYSALVGRDDELKLLELQVTNAVEGKGSVIFISGEAGIGKSRLVAELRNRAVMNKVTLFEGMAISIGKNLSFHPIVDILKQWAGIQHNDDDNQAFEKLRNAITGLFPENSDEVLPFVAILMGMKLTEMHRQRTNGIEGESLKRLILKNMRDVLIRASQWMPLVLVIDDMHWADDSTIELTESLFRLAASHRIIFIVIFRMSYRETIYHLSQTVKENSRIPFVEIVLGPLSEESSKRLIANMLGLGEIHHALIDSIVARTGGNPFFIEEVVRSLIDVNVLFQYEGIYHLSDKAAAVAIPSTIEVLLMARIDRLEDRTRELIKVASVIGRSFFHRILLEVASKIDNIDERLLSLLDLQLLRERMRMGELEYLFNHALVQEVVYQSILPATRKEIHYRVAQTIEHLFDERFHEYYGMLAYHYCMAETMEKADICLIKAGEEALKSSASSEALHYFQEAFTLYRKLQGNHAEPEKIAMFEKYIGLALFDRGNHIEALQHFDKALHFYWKDLPENFLSEGFRFLTSFIKFLLALYFPSRWFRGIPTPRDIEAIDLFYKKCEVLVVFNPKRFFIETFIYLEKIIRFDLSAFKLGVAIFAGASSLFFFPGISFSIGKKILESVKHNLNQDDTGQWMAHNLSTYDLLETSLRYLEGNWQDISDSDEQLINKRLKIGETWHASQQYYWHGLVKTYQGRFAEAETLASNLNNIAVTYENKFSYCLKYLLHVTLLIECRRIPEAISEVSRGIDLFQKWGFAIPLLNLHCMKALAHILVFDMENARISLENADRIRKVVPLVPLQVSNFFRSQFEYDLRRLESSFLDGRKKETATFRRKAKKSGKKLLKNCRKAAQFRTEAYRFMGVFRWLMRDRKGAFKWWDRAIAEGKKIGALPQLARTYAEMGRLLGSVQNVFKEPDIVRSAEFINLAIILFGELGLIHDLEVLNLQNLLIM